MKITDFNKIISEYEGKKKNVDIAQISEIMRIANMLTENRLYAEIKKTNESVAKSIAKQMSSSGKKK